MSVLSRDALQDSPLADLHEIASALGIDGFRRLRKDDLVDTIIERQGGDAGSDAGDEPAAEDRPARSRSRRGGRSRTRRDAEPADEAPESDDEPAQERPSRSRRRRSGDDEEAPAKRTRSRSGDRDRADDDDEAESTVEGAVEILANGSGFIRVGEGESDGDVYISAAQVRRCDLVAGDRIGGPVRRPRRSAR